MLPLECLLRTPSDDQLVRRPTIRFRDSRRGFHAPIAAWDLFSQGVARLSSYTNARTWVGRVPWQFQQRLHRDGAAPDPLPLRVNALWTFAGNTVYMVCQWGIVVVFAKLGNAAMVGRFSLALAITAPIVLFSGLQLRGIQSTDPRSYYGFSDYFSLRLLTTALALMLIACIATMGTFTREVRLVILLVGCAKSAEAISDISYGVFQQFENMKRISVSMALRGGLSLIVVAVAVRVTGSLVVGLTGLLAVWVAVLLAFDLPGARKLCDVTEHGRLSEARQAKWATLLKLAKLALPLGIIMGLISLTANAPRYYVERYRGESELGIFAAISYLAVAGNAIVQALAQSAAPRLARHYAEGALRDFRRLLLRLSLGAAGIGTLGVTASVVAGRQLLNLFYHPEYSKHVDVLILIMMASGFQYVGTFLGVSLTAIRALRRQIPVQVLSLGTTFILSAVLVPYAGLRGAACSVLVVSALTLAIYTTMVWLRVSGRDTAEPAVVPLQTP
jgi:O-antigen/teichoic acid export membrane protein